MSQSLDNQATNNESTSSTDLTSFLRDILNKYYPTEVRPVSNSNKGVQENTLLTRMAADISARMSYEVFLQNRKQFETDLANKILNQSVIIKDGTKDIEFTLLQLYNMSKEDRDLYKGNLV